jgi:hypothetical protein
LTELAKDKDFINLVTGKDAKEEKEKKKKIENEEKVEDET